MKKIHDESHENNERWLLTYSDLITLLMIFFVVMYAMSSLNQTKYQQLAMSLNSALQGGTTLIGTDSGPDVKKGSNAVVQPVDQEQQVLNQLKASIDKYIQQNGLSQNVETMVDQRGVVVRVENSVLFDSGSATVRNDAKKTIIGIGRMLQNFNNYIRVEGNTDNIPIVAGPFKSNWQLSAIRATNVAELLIDNCKISPERIAAVGYGEYRPIADNSTYAGRAKNRRVDIVVLNSKYDTVEQNKN